MTSVGTSVGTCRGCDAHREMALVKLGVRPDSWDYLVALAGNPNTGKSTVFNALTGLRQHTGNWPGKTVARAEGSFISNGKRAKVVDLPGTYSLQAGSVDEEVARDFVLFGQPDVTVIVVDATRLERNLNLVLQILEITDRVVVGLNLTDEAKRHGIDVDPNALARELGVPVVAMVARRHKGIDELRNAIDAVATGAVHTHPRRLRQYPPAVEQAVHPLADRIADAYPDLPNTRWVALRLLNGDGRVIEGVRAGDLVALSRNGDAGPAAASDVRERGGSDGDRILEAAQHLRWQLPHGFQDQITQRVYAEAEQITEAVVRVGARRISASMDGLLDRLLTSRSLGVPMMGVVLAVVFWITISGANYPSSLLAALLIDTVHPALWGVASTIGTPTWLAGVLLDGVYLATAWVVSVMLPPMAIFFPLFTLLEDFGYLPRVAFNLDRLFQITGAHGKQALTMCMGFGCNAAGVVATRVIDSPRERLIAVITNNFSLCNGRWPTQILIATIFIGAIAPAHLASLVSAASVVGIALLGIGMMFFASWLLSNTVLRGEATTFSLELPPYRPPRILQTLYTSMIDRTLIILGRAVLFAAPAGAITWVVANVAVGDMSISERLTNWLDPVGLLIGLNGIILLAYVVAIPANEIVIPVVLMLTVLGTGLTGVGEGAGVMFELDSASAVGDVLAAGGWTLLTGVSLMLFSLLHNPCSTTIYTIYKETRSVKWTTVSALLPLGIGFAVCFVVTQLWRLTG